MNVLRSLRMPRLMLVVSLSALGGCTSESNDLKRSAENLRRFGMAMHLYHDQWKGLPPAGSMRSKDGLALSWRVRVLSSFGDEGMKSLGSQFHLDEAWDSPHNRELIPLMPDIYKVAGKYKGDFKTSYLAVTQPVSESPANQHERTIFGRGTRVYSHSAIVDGLGTTIMIVEADEAVTWTQPSDWEFDFDHPKHGIGGLRSSGDVMSLFADGSVRMIPKKISDDDLKWLVSAIDGDGGSREKRILESLYK